MSGFSPEFTPVQAASLGLLGLWLLWGIQLLLKVWEGLGVAGAGSNLGNSGSYRSLERLCLAWALMQLCLDLGSCSSLR